MFLRSLVKQFSVFSHFSYRPICLFLSLLCVAALGSQVYAAQINPQKWNIIFFAIDDINGWTGHLGKHPNAKTPNVDKLAARGISFRHAYAPVPHCLPARAALMTGLRPWESGVYHGGNSGWFNAIKNKESIPQFFSRHGYQTMGTGKIFHNGNAGHTTPGYWDEFKKVKGKDPKPKKPTTVNINLSWGAAGKDKKFKDYKRVTWAISKLNKNYNKPFFLAVGLQKPHLAWYVPKAYYKLHPLNNIVLPQTLANDLNDVPPIGVDFALNVENQFFNDHQKMLKAGKWKNAVQAYLASSSFADAQFGRLLKALDNSQYKNNTMIVLWGDHGWHLGEKQHWRKHALWEEATNTSYVIYIPGLGNQGRIIDEPVDLMSIYPTLAEVTGLPEPGTAGVSVVPLLEGSAQQWDHPAIMTYFRRNHAVRQGNYRYIRYKDGTEELYDHSVDPKEWTNLADDPSLEHVKTNMAAYLPTDEAPNVP